MYDAFSSDYDRFMDWPTRLSVEMPFVEHQLATIGVQRVLDAACGTGMHVIALAQRGYDAAGADLSPKMIERARENAAAAGLSVRFEVAAFGKLRRIFGSGSFDALLCLGNSLPHVLTPDDLSRTLEDFAACLRPGGFILVQNRNFDNIIARQERWMEPQAYREGEREWLFLRFYDFEAEEFLIFNLVTLQRQGESAWQQNVSSTRLRALHKANLADGLSKAGFGEIACYGDMTGAPFNPQSSANLVVTGIKQK